MKSAPWCGRRTLLYLLVGSLVANLSLVYILHSNETPTSSGLHAGRIAFLGAEWRQLGSFSNPLAAPDAVTTPIPRVNTAPTSTSNGASDISHDEPRSIARAAESVKNGAAAAEAAATIAELDRGGSEHDDRTDNDLRATLTGEIQKHGDYGSDAVCMPVDVVAPVHWRIGQPLPVLLTAHRGAPVEAAATVELLVASMSAAADESSFDGRSSHGNRKRTTSGLSSGLGQRGVALACCDAVLHRGRGSCLLEWGACNSSSSNSTTSSSSRDNGALSPIKAMATSNSGVSGATAWLRITDAVWLVSGQQPKHPLDNSPFVEIAGVGSDRRVGNDYSRVNAVTRAAVCPQAVALMQPLLPAKLPPFSSTEDGSSRTNTLRGVRNDIDVDQDNRKMVRRVVGGTLDAYRTVWGPYEEVVVESSIGLVVGGQNNSAAIDPKGGGFSLTILEGTMVYLQPGAEIVVKAGARLLLYGDRRRPVTFMPEPQRDQRWRHPLDNHDSELKSERSGSTRQDSMPSAHYGPRGFAPSVSGAAWALKEDPSSNAGKSKSNNHQEQSSGPKGRGGRGEAGAWGEVRVEGGGRLVAMHTIFTGGGGLGPVDRVFGHSGSRPVLRAGDLGPNAPSVNGPPHLTLIGGAIVDCPGKAIASSDAIVTLRGVLVSRVDTGGEHRRSAVTMQRCHVVEIPALARHYRLGSRRGFSSSNHGAGLHAWTEEEVDDSDGIYLKGVFGSHKRSKNEARRGSLIQDCTFAHGADDAIDINGATATIHRTVVDGWAHEGVAASGGGGSQNANQDVVLVLVKDSLIRACGQGIEAGYGYPQVRVHRVMTENCGTAFRFGDGYNWKYQGRLTVTQSAAVASSKHQRSIWDWIWAKPPNAYTAASPAAKEAALATVRASGDGRTAAGVGGGARRSAEKGGEDVDESEIEVALRGGYASGDTFAQCSTFRRHLHSGSGIISGGVVDNTGISTNSVNWIKAAGSSERLESNSKLLVGEFGCPTGISSPALFETWLVGHLSEVLGGTHSMATSQASPVVGRARAAKMSVPGALPNSNTVVHGFGPLDEPRFTEPSFVRGDCGEELLADFSAAQASAEQWGAWAGKGWMKDTFPATFKAQRYEGPLAPSTHSTSPDPNTTRDDLDVRVVYARVKTHFLDRFERQYGFNEYKNWHELPSHERSLVALSRDTAQVVRPTLELLSHLRHPNVARVLKLCGPHRQPLQQLFPLSSSSSKSTDVKHVNGAGISSENSTMVDVEEDQSFAAWSSARGFDFTFAQELADGVAINHKSPPPKQKQKQKNTSHLYHRLSTSVYEAPVELGLIDLAIELVTALVALHESPVGAVVHGDLKWSNIITHPALPVLKLIDFDNAILLGGDNSEQGWTMPAQPIAFCCDMGKGHNHLAPECQKCQTLSTKMDVYVVGQRLLNFYDQQRINMYKQLGCVTSIYATSALDSNGTIAAACDPYGDVELSLRSLVRNAPRIDSSYPGMIEVMAECLRINPLKRPRMSQVLDALFAVRTRASMQPITIARRAAFFATTGLTTLSSTTSRLRYAKEPLSTAPILYLDVLGRDGSDALIGWRKLLTAPFLGLKQAASNEHEGSRASRNSHGKKGGAGNEGISWSSMSLWVVPGTVQQYSHSFLRGAGTHGCGLRFVGHAHNLVNSPWAETSPSSSSSSSPPERLKIARDLSSARVMVKATHSDNGHFDDESLYREIKLFALDQLLGTRLALPCIGARVDLASPSLALAARALDSKAKAHSGRPPVPDSHKVSCLRPGTSKDTSDHSSSTTTTSSSSSNIKGTSELELDKAYDPAETVDAAVCLYLDYASPQAVQGLTGASTAANQAAYANPPDYKPTKFKSVPAALAAAEAWIDPSQAPDGGGDVADGAAEKPSSTPSPPSKPPLSSKAIKSTRTPSFFAADDARSSESPGSKNDDTQAPLYTPSHANAAEYAVVSFLANCAKSSHNHFALALQKPPSSSAHSQSLESLVMVDNDRCFVPNAVLRDASDAAPSPEQLAGKLNTSSFTADAKSNSNSASAIGAMPQEHRERFTRWRRLLWSTCAWLGPAYDETRDHDATSATSRAAATAANAAGDNGTSRGASGSAAEANDAAAGGVLGGGVQDLIARLRWHQGQGVLGATANEKPPTVSAALRHLLADDVLASGLLATDRKAFNELDGRVTELLNRADQCERALELRDFHRSQPFAVPLEQQQQQQQSLTSSASLRSPSSSTWRLDTALDGDHPKGGDGTSSDSSPESSASGSGSQSTRPRCHPVSAVGPEVCSVHAPVLVSLR